MIPVPPCPPVTVVAPAEHISCDLDGSQILVEVGLTAAECEDAGGRPLVLGICWGRDY